MPAFYCSLSICRGLWWPVKRVLLGRHCPLQQSTRAVGNVSFLKWIYNWKSEHRFHSPTLDVRPIWQNLARISLLRDNIIIFIWFLQLLKSCVLLFSGDITVAWKRDCSFSSSTDDADQRKISNVLRLHIEHRQLGNNHLGWQNRSIFSCGWLLSPLIKEVRL